MHLHVMPFAGVGLAVVRNHPNMRYPIGKQVGSKPSFESEPRE
jgi:hypothetical protein